MNNESIILSIETSCDDTSASVVKNGTKILSNIVSSQDYIHVKYGGIVPELASRRHIEIIWQVVQEALADAEIGLDDISALAVCYAPGLIGSLIVGCSFAKSISYAKNIPLIGVNHLEGHIFTSLLLDKPPEFPFLSLLISGGHTSLYRVNGFKDIKELGRTRDDAAGEAYDKVARMLGLGFPGGHIIDKLSQKGNPQKVSFPRAYMPNTFDFSFSGLKTAVRNFLAATANNNYSIEDICASFQAAVIDVLVKKIQWAVSEEKINRVFISGGVASNIGLRERLVNMADTGSLEAFIPPQSLCTDNAAMIAAAGHLYYINNSFTDLSLNPKSHMPL